MKYQHLSQDNRATIAAEVARGTPAKVIAAMTGCHLSTIYREIKRNGLSGGHYEGYAAHKKARRRRSKASGLPRKLKGKLLRKVLAKMKKGWSPDAIAGRMGGISTRALYDYLHRCQREPSHNRPRYLVRRLRAEPPFCYLKQGLGAYRKRGKAAPPLTMADALPIRQRPADAETRAHAGHYETDTAMVKGGALLFAVCRASRFVWGRKLQTKSSDAVARAMIDMMANGNVKTITSDRGSEFARYRLIENKVGARWYVCDARRPDQRGGIEGIIRQMRHHYPCRMAAEDITPAALAATIRRLNNTPRKSLNYKTPAEVIKEIGRR